MPKFNEKPSIERKVESHPDLTENYEGGVAFRTNAKNELYLRAATWLVGEPKFYTDKSADDEPIRSLVAEISKTDPEFVFKLASYLRNELYLRSAPMFLLTESLANPESKKLVRKWIPHVVKRADEFSELMSCFINRNGEIGSNGKASLPNQLKLGLSDTFHNFNEYDFGKYKMSDKAVKLSDVLRLVHPKPLSTEESELFKRIRTDTLAVPETWETVISEKGNNKDAWNEVIPKMGYMAKLRNLRNIAQAGADIESVLKHLTNPKAVANSKQFPYRFLSAYKMIEGAGTHNPFDKEEGVSIDPFVKKQILSALETAMTISVKNIPNLGGRTLVSVDNSGSMQAPVSERSKIERREIGAVMGAMANGFCDAAVASAFGTRFMTVNISGKSILGDAQKILESNTDSATNGYLVFKYLADNKLLTDRVMIFTDEQLWDTDARARSIWGGMGSQESLYKWFLKYKQMQPNVRLYLFDLAGYGSVQIPDTEPNVAIIGGFSDRVFDFIKRFEEDRSKVLEAIDKYDPTAPKAAEEDE
jgi:hypothetical protein